MYLYVLRIPTYTLLIGIHIIYLIHFIHHYTLHICLKIIKKLYARKRYNKVIVYVYSNYSRGKILFPYEISNAIIIGGMMYLRNI